MDKNMKHRQLDSRGIELLEPIVLLANETNAVGPALTALPTIPPTYFIARLLNSLSRP
jgi:hypothetical protein